MDIVFVRHGLAEDRSPSLRDEERQLVPKGEARTKATLAKLKKKLSKGRPVVILTSPALRASQTAEVLSQGLEKPEVVTVNAIYEGSLDLFLEAEAQVPREAVILVVGHEPLLGMWSQQLSGQRIDYKKSGMAAFTRQSEAPLRLKPVWLHRVQLDGADDRLEPAPPAFTVEQFRHIMIHRVMQADDMRQAFLREPEQPATVHRFRVALRQCRSLLSYMRPVIKKKQVRGALAALKNISSQLADLRETDVLTSHWRDFLVERPEYAADEDISRVLADVRAFQQRDAVDFASQTQVGQTLQDVVQWVDGWGPQDLDLSGSALKRWDKWTRDIQEGIQALDVDDLESIHRLRLKIKKLRYAATAIPILRLVDGPDLDELKTLQDNLGDVCDTHVHLNLLRQLVPDEEQAHSVPHREAFIAWLNTLRDDILLRLKQQPPHPGDAQQGSES